MKKVKVYIERSEDGCFYAYAANPMILPYGLTGEGDSVEQAKTDWLNVYEATRRRSLHSAMMCHRFCDIMPAN